MLCTSLLFWKINEILYCLHAKWFYQKLRKEHSALGHSHTDFETSVEASRWPLTCAGHAFSNVTPQCVAALTVWKQWMLMRCCRQAKSNTNTSEWGLSLGRKLKSPPVHLTFAAIRPCICMCNVSPYNYMYGIRTFMYLCLCKYLLSWTLVSRSRSLQIAEACKMHWCIVIIVRASTYTWMLHIAIVLYGCAL